MEYSVSGKIKRPVEEHLNLVDYEFAGYMPTEEALRFVNFIKAVNGGEEENKTPPVHLVMMERVFNEDRRCAIMCHRGVGKALALDTPILTPNGYIPMRDIEVGQKVINRNGKEVKVKYKSEIFDKPTYKVKVSDGTEFEACEDHYHIVQRRTQTIKDGKRINIWKEEELTTKEIVENGYTVKASRNPEGTTPKYYIPLISEAVEFNNELECQMDPYTVGVILGDGNIDKDSGHTRVCSHIDDVEELRSYIPYDLSLNFPDKRHPDTVTFGINGIGGVVRQFIGTNNTYTKSIPDAILYGSKNDRLECLRGLMDTDGYCTKSGLGVFTTVSKPLANGVVHLAKSLGGHARIKWFKQTNPKYKDYANISIVLPGLNAFKLKRKASRFDPNKVYKSGSRLAIESIELIDHSVLTQCISVDCPTKSFLIDGCLPTRNTTLFAEYLILYMAAFGVLPGFGPVNLMLYVTDSIENGVKNLRRNVEYRYQESEFLQHIIPNQRITVGENDGGYVGLDEYETQSAGGRKFTDIRLEFMNNKGHRLVVKGYGAKGNTLDTILYTPTGYTTIGDVQVGDKIYGVDGKLANVIEKSEIFDKPIYQITLEDGRQLKVSDDHINSVVIKENYNNYAKFVEHDIITTELVKEKLVHQRKRSRKGKPDYISNENLIFIKNTEALQYPDKNLIIDPYTLGLLVGDGSMQHSTALHAHKDDMPYYMKYIPYKLGKLRQDPRHNGQTLGILNLREKIKSLKLNCHGDFKFIPEEYFTASYTQRIELLRGLMDTDGSIQSNGRMDYCSNSEQLVDDVSGLVRSLGGTAKKRKTGKAFRVEIWIDKCIFKLPRKVERFTGTRTKNLVAIKSIELVKQVPSQCIAIDNESHQYLAGSTKRDYFRTHNTGVRGAKEMGQRPQLAILDDLISDEDARSATIVETIENTIYKAVSKALHPTNQKMVFIGTPFNANDPLYKAVESGAWTVSVFPICEKFPVTKEEFRGSWEDRFTYEYVQAEYEEAMDLHRPENFNQELMLRIMSEEDRLIQNDDMVWISRNKILNNKTDYNFYITTDFATSAKKGADYSVISVWAYNNNGDWMLVDGVCKQQLMDQNMTDLFRLVSMYRPLSVGVEVSGQQGGFVRWIHNEMIDKNIFFNLASSRNSNEPGIRPTSDKLTRFNQILPLFKAKKIWFAEEMRDTEYGRELVDELTNVSKKGFKSKHDDVSDTISMLSELEAYKPSTETPSLSEEFNVDASIWAEFADDQQTGNGSTIF